MSINYNLKNKKNKKNKKTKNKFNEQNSFNIVINLRTRNNYLFSTVKRVYLCNMTYDEYLKLIFVKHYHFMNDDLKRKKFDNYLHLTEKEFNLFADFINKYELNISTSKSNDLTNILYYFTYDKIEKNNQSLKFISDFQQLQKSIYSLHYFIENYECHDVYYLFMRRKIYSSELTNERNMNEWYDTYKNTNANGTLITALFMMKTNKKIEKKKN